MKVIKGKRPNMIFIYRAPLRTSQQGPFNTSLLFRESPAPIITPCGGGGFELKFALQYPVLYEIPHSILRERTICCMVHLLILAAYFILYVLFELDFSLRNVLLTQPPERLVFFLEFVTVKQSLACCFLCVMCVPLC